MDGTDERHDEPLTTPHVLPVLPTELWFTILEHVVTDDTHIFDQSFVCRRTRTRDIQRLQFVCRLWRDIIKPLSYHHIALNGNDSNGSQHSYRHAANKVAALACALNQTTDSGTPKASLVRSFWIQRSGREEGTEPSLTALQEELPALISRMTNLGELYCRVDLRGPQFASIARSHGSQLTKLAVQSGATTSHSIRLPEMLPLLKQFTALTDLQLGVHAPAGDLDSVDPPNLPNLQSLQLLVDVTTNVLMTQLTRWNMPILSSFAWKRSFSSSWHMCDGSNGLSTFMAKFGAGLRLVKIDDSCAAIQLAVFPHTPGMEVFDVFDAKEVFENLPISVTLIVLRGLGRNLGDQMRTLARLFQTVQLLPPEKKLHTIRVVSSKPRDNEYFHNEVPFVWREKVQQADTRRVDTWKLFKSYAKGLLELGVLILDEQDVSLTDVLEEMGALQESVCTELVESATDTLVASKE